MRSLFVATGNRHKVTEIRALLGAGFTVLSQGDTNARLDIRESADTFAGNALIKAVNWSAYLGTDCCDLNVEAVLADDSGLEVDALGGAPGVHSARFAAPDGAPEGNSSDGENNAKLLRLLNGVPDERRTARFRCVLALVPVMPGTDAECLVKAARFFEGTCPGRIRRDGAGRAGFGYDPLFIPDGHSESFAELGEETKNQLSHRGRAIAAMRAQLG